MKAIKCIFLYLNHLTLVLAVLFLIYAILDWYNPMMGFMTSDFSNRALIIFCISSAALSVFHLQDRAK